MSVCLCGDKLLSIKLTLPEEIKNKMKKLRTEDILVILRDYLAGRGDVIFAYLFGSYAKEKQTHLSDIDVAVYMKDDTQAFDKKLEILSDLTKNLATDDIDLVILNKAPISLLTKILAHKIILNDKIPTIRHSFESLNMRMGFDFSYLEKRILDQRFSI
jgi:predicted nucleotidyltransferase